jgi:hypothetical protein
VKSLANLGLSQIKEAFKMLPMKINKAKVKE